MNTSLLKKVAAGVSAIAILSLNLASLATVNAAALNGATAVVTPATDIVVTSAGAFAGSTTCTATITQTNTNGTTTAVTVDSCTPAANTLTIAASTVAANKYYTITFNTDDGVFGSATAGDTTNDVQVTATVVPTLSMSISAPNIALGVLTTAGYSTGSVDIVTATNAVSGADVTMASAGLSDATVNKQIGVVGIGAIPTTAATDYYKIQSKVASQANVAQVFNDINGADLFAAAGTDMTASQVVLDGTTATDSSTTTTVTVGAHIAATTEAGNYSDTLTFTVTGSF